MAQNFVIGIDLGGTNTKIGLLDSHLKIKKKVIFPTQKFAGRDNLINALCSNIKKLLYEHRISKTDISGIGIGLPGPIDSKRGVVHYFPNIRGFKNVSLAKIIRAKTGISVLIDNDVNLITLAEFKLGAGRFSHNMVCLTLGTGVGGGIIVEGYLYRGSSGSAGELGHIPVSFGGPKCGCGATGCLESYIGNNRILKKAHKSFGDIKLEELSRKAKEGNREAKKLWQDVGKCLGLALCGVVNFFNPDTIVIGGGISGAGSILFNSVRKVIKKRAMVPSRNIVKIVKARLGQDAGIIGAGLLVKSYLKSFIFITLYSLLFTCYSFSAATEEAEPVTVDGDKVEVMSAENKVEALGNVVITYKGIKLTCDKVTVNTLTKDTKALGRVRIDDKGSVILADEAEYNLDSKKGIMFNGHIISPPFYAKADFMEKLSDKEVKMYKGYFTTCDREKPHYRLKAKEMDFSLGEKLTARDINFMVYNSSLAYLPKYVHPLNDNRPRVTVTPGMSKDWGFYALSAWRYYFNEDLRGRVHLDYRERKDFALGFDTKYDTRLFGEGFLRTYYMNERKIELKKPWISSLSENVKEELLGLEDVDEKNRNTVERERYRISLRHNWDIDDDTNLKLEYNRLSDASFLTDYFYREYEKGIFTSTSSYALFTRLMPFSTLSVFGEKRVNRLESKLEKLPEIKVDISSSELGVSNFYYSGTSSIANLNNKSASPSDSDTSVNRVETYNKISYPKKVAFIETSPYVGGRFTYYDRDLESSSADILRGNFETGIDMSTKFYRIFDIKTNFLNLDINRVRHVITPSIGYSYVHEPTVPASKLFSFDGSVSKSNNASLSLENKLQTKRGDKAVDLLRFIMSTNYTFHLKPQGSRFGNINLDFEATPYDWMRFEADSEYDKDDRAFKTANFDLVLMGEKEKFKTQDDDYKYFFGAGYRYQRNSRNQFTTQLTYRLNEDWKFKAYERWERETGGLREQGYVIYKDLHCWQMEVNYNVRRDHGEEIFLVFRIKAFPENGVEFNNSYHAPKAGQLSY